MTGKEKTKREPIYRLIPSSKRIQLKELDENTVIKITVVHEPETNGNSQNNTEEGSVNA